MTRFLLFTGPVTGHVTPVLPISRALIERGHQVAWITGKVFKERVEATGATYYRMPPTYDPGEMGVYEFAPELAKMRGIEQLKRYFKHYFLSSCPAQIEAINAVLDQFQADVLVGCPAMLGVYFKAELSGIPSAMICVGPLAGSSPDTAPFGLALLPGKGIIAEARNRFLNWAFDNVLMRDLNAYANQVRGELGLPPRLGPFWNAIGEYPTLVMAPTTRAFEYPRRNQPEHLYFIGPLLPRCDPNFSPPAWWPDLSGDRPVILVTQGTVAKDLHDLYVPAIEGLRDENMLVLAIPVGEHALDAIPENVRTATFTPFANLLPRVDVMVTNAGYGGTQLALAHGVPLVVAGATEEKMEVAVRVEWSGAGINLRKQRPSPSEIRKAVKQVLTNPSYRENAQRIQRDFAKYNGPQCAAELLESLATRETECPPQHNLRREIS
jgi:UDP:flavonoid glycosyltransferase YjiC (YdhE family)